MLQRYHKSINIYVPDERSRELWHKFLLDPVKDDHFLVFHKRNFAGIYSCTFVTKLVELRRKLILLASSPRRRWSHRIHICL